MPEILHNGTNFRTLPTTPPTLLKPGANEVSDEAVALVRAHPYLSQLEQSGEFLIREAAKAGSRTLGKGLPQSLEGLSLEDCREACSRITEKTIPVLKRWAGTNGSAAVRELLEKRYAELVPDTDNSPHGELQ